MNDKKVREGNKGLDLFTFPQNSPQRRIYGIVSFLIVFVFLPVYLFLVLWANLLFFALFYFFCLAALAFHFHKYLTGKRRFSIEKENLQESFNLAAEENSLLRRNASALRKKIERYEDLKKITEEINASLDLDSVADKLAEIAFSLIAGNKGVCLLYLAGGENNSRINLCKAKKEDPALIIKEKQGDIFDFWVLRHSTPLLIEDLRKDFRFDLQKLRETQGRQVGSLVSSPLASRHRFLGILRLDNFRAFSYTQDDLRFLAILCGLAAVAMENSELFQKTQDLAIHDSLTSLFTKGYFMDRLRESCLRSMRGASVFSLLLLDIDHFKEYNDKFGHAAGDIVLKKLSLALAENLSGRPAVLSRFGGEEFCILLEGMDKAQAYKLGERLRRDIEKMKVFLRRQETGVTVSGGLAVFPEDAKDEVELIFKADKAMYEAKHKGRNCLIKAQ